MGTGKVRIGEFEFDSTSGELRNVDTGVLQRLAPQPARLLTLLLDRRGELLPRDEIRDELWPSVEVDFDTSLHFCIRQIRSALGDTADRPRFVENLPRRGYRIVTPPAVEAGDDHTTGRVRSLRGRGVLAAVPVMILLALLAWVAIDRPWSTAIPPISRIGVMPFSPPDMDEAWGRPQTIAETILERLVERGGDRVEVVGPTTTAGLAPSGSSRDLVREFHLDYLINGRFIKDESGRRMLVELIRADDGAHVWVRSYTDLDRHEEIGRQTVDAMLQELESPRQRR